MAAQLRFKPKSLVAGHDRGTLNHQFEWVAEDAAFGQDTASEGKHLDLQFVSETGNARPRGSSRQLIRSHARRKRNTVASNSRAVPRQNESSDTSRRNDSLSDKVWKQSLDSSNKSENMDVDLHFGKEIAKIDPFDSLPLASHTRVYSLLAHFDKVARHMRGIPGPREGWLSFAITDSAVLSTILFIAALDIAGLRGKAENSDVLYWKGETIRVINSRLDDPRQMATDGTIAAVAALSHLENLVGTAQSAKIHANALDVMVKSRGGLQSLGADGMPRRIVSWADIATSIILETKPRYEPVASKEHDVVDIYGPYSRLALLYKNKLRNLTGSEEFSGKAIDIYWELRNLFRLKEIAAFCLTEGDVIENVPFTDTADHLERRVVPLTQLEPLANPSQSRAIYTLFGYAALAHMYLFMRDCSKDLPFSHMLSSRIRMVLEKVDMQRLQNQYPEMMLWILIMGGLSGSPLSERVWFAERVAEFCLELGLSGGNQIASMLEDFLWSKLYRSPVTRRFWTEVAKAQGFEKGYEVHRLADHVSVVCFNAPPDFDD